MLLVLHDSLAKALDQNTVLEALEMIALARREGKHLVFAKRDVLKSLLNCAELSKRTRQVYLKLYAQLAEMQVYLQTLSRRVEVIALDTGLSSRLEKHCKVISVPARYFSNSSLIQKTILLTENLDDATLYQTITQIYLKWKKLKKIAILFEAYAGGGSTTKKAYQRIQDQAERFCLCLLDSDKKSPNSPLGNTAKEVKKIENPNQPLCEYLILGVREIENLIPIQLYSLVSSGDVNRMPCVDLLEQLEKTSLAEARKYLDIKNGLKLNEILEASKNSPFSKDWMNWLKNVSSLDIAIKKNCLKHEACMKGENCDCIITTGFGDKILEAVIKVIETPTKDQPTQQKIVEMVDPLLKAEWEAIGEMITAWCCGTSRISTASN
jgi:hypothetical protein